MAKKKRNHSEIDMKQLWGIEITPGWGYALLDEKVSNPWWYGLLFFPAGLLSLFIFGPLAWIVNPPWRPRDYND